MRYCRKCDEYVPDSEVNDLFHTVCHTRTVPQWSEERRLRLRAEKRIKELEAENKQLLELSENLNEHPEGYNGPCLCQLCKSYG